MGFWDRLFGKPKPARRPARYVVIESPRGKRYRVAPGSKAVSSLQRQGWRVVNPTDLNQAWERLRTTGRRLAEEYERLREQVPNLRDYRSYDDFERAVARWEAKMDKLMKQREQVATKRNELRRRMMASNPRLSTAERAALPDSAFAAPEIRALPVHDAAHIRAALGRFSQTVFPSKAAAQAAARRIVEAAKEHGVPVSEKTAVAQMAGMYVERVPERWRNLDAYTDDAGVIHPIRGSEGYDSYYDSASHRAFLADQRKRVAAANDWREGWEEDDWADQVRQAVKSVSKYGIAPHAGKREGWEYRHDVPLYLKNKRGLPADEVAQLIAYEYPYLGIETEDDLLQALAEGAGRRRHNPKRPMLIAFTTDKRGREIAYRWDNSLYGA
ncbi:MAG: DUF6582 domain-containing protein [Sphingomonadaceae bacterium]